MRIASSGIQHCAHFLRRETALWQINAFSDIIACRMMDGPMRLNPQVAPRQKAKTKAKAKAKAKGHGTPAIASQRRVRSQSAPPMFPTPPSQGLFDFNPGTSITIPAEGPGNPQNPVSPFAAQSDHSDRAADDWMFAQADLQLHPGYGEDHSSFDVEEYEAWRAASGYSPDHLPPASPVSSAPLVTLSVSSACAIVDYSTQHGAVRSASGRSSSWSPPSSTGAIVSDNFLPKSVSSTGAIVAGVEGRTEQMPPTQSAKLQTIPKLRALAGRPQPLPNETKYFSTSKSTTTRFHCINRKSISNTIKETTTMGPGNLGKRRAYTRMASLIISIKINSNTSTVQPPMKGLNSSSSSAIPAKSTLNIERFDFKRLSRSDQSRLAALSLETMQPPSPPSSPESGTFEWFLRQGYSRWEAATILGGSPDESDFIEDEESEEQASTTASGRATRQRVRNRPRLTGHCIYSFIFTTGSEEIEERCD